MVCGLKPEVPFGNPSLFVHPQRTSLSFQLQDSPAPAPQLRLIRIGHSSLYDGFLLLFVFVSIELSDSRPEGQELAVVARVQWTARLEWRIPGSNR
jgi:hypothetical protein